MKREGTNHNGVVLDASGQPLSKYARKLRERRKEIERDMETERQRAARHKRVFNGQHLGNVNDD